MKTKPAIFALTIFSIHLAYGQIKVEGLKVDTTITGFHFAANFEGTYVYTPNGKSDLNIANPSALSFTVMPNATYQDAHRQIEYLLNMAKQDGFTNTDVFEKDTTIDGNQAYYTLFTQTLKGTDYRNIVFYAFYLKDNTALLFISGDLNNGKYIENIKKTFYSTKL